MPTKNRDRRLKKLRIIFLETKVSLSHTFVDSVFVKIAVQLNRHCALPFAEASLC